MPEAILSLVGVNTHIEQYHILQGVDFEVPRGGLTMLLGRNGAGKTTTLRTIMGLWQASAGTIHYDGRNITRTATPELARLGIAYVPENMGIFAGLTVKENMLLAAREKQFDDQRLDWIFRLFPAMQKFWNTLAGNLSGGQKQMLAISRAIIEPRKLLLIDEPTEGLAPMIVDELFTLMAGLARDGIPIVLVEQNINRAIELASRFYVLERGQVVLEGRAGEPGDRERLLAQIAV